VRKNYAVTPQIAHGLSAVNEFQSKLRAFMKKIGEKRAGCVQTANFREKK
jgi:hypothetical protein